MLSSSIFEPIVLKTFYDSDGDYDDESIYSMVAYFFKSIYNKTNPMLLL
jgi:hypothetical protein